MLALVRLILAALLALAGLTLALVSAFIHGPGTAVCAWLVCQVLAAIVMPDIPTGPDE